MIDKIAKRFERIYVLFFMIYLLCNSILVFLMNTSEKVRNIMSIFFIVTGGILLLYKIFRDRKTLFSNKSIILYIFIIISSISSLFMKDYGIINNIKTIIWMCITFGIIYTHFFSMTNDKMKKEYKCLINILNVLWCVAIVVSLYQFVNQIGYTIKYSGSTLRKAQGFYYNRLFGIFVDPNFAAATTAVLFFSTIFLIKDNKSKIYKFISALICILYFIYIILSGSRTGLLLLIVGTLIYSFLVAKKKFKKQSLGILKCCLAVICCMVILFGCIVGAKKMLPYVPNMIQPKKADEITSNTIEVKETKKAEQSNEANNKSKVNETQKSNNSNNSNNKVDISRTDLEGKKDASNLRLQLWENCIQIAKSRILFGTSPRNIIELAKSEFPNTYPAKGYDCGNGFLSIFVYTGIFGTIVMGIFIIICIWSIIKYIFKSKKYDSISILFITLIGIIAVDALLNQEIFFINSINTGIFWLVLGGIMKKANEKEYEDDNGEIDKIGIVTIHDADNYGSDLQAYATQRAIEKLGYNAYILDHDCVKISKEYGIKRIFAQENFKKAVEALIKIFVSNPARKRFIKFRNDNYKLRPKEDDQSKYKKIIVGSDQVWNYKITDMDKDYFLNFVTDESKRVAYSSSFGITEVPGNLKSEYKELLNKIPNIAVREEQGAKLIKELTGREVPVVLDPTLLIDKEEWQKISKMPYKESGYILCYQIAHSPSLAKFAEELSLKTGKKIISIQGSLRQKFNAKYIWDAGPSEYIGLIQNADYVITNSFHGTAFSINLNKKFFTEMLPSREKTSSRLENILDSFDLRSRQIVNGKNEDMLSEIDYTEINKKLLKEREKSINILKDYIEKA